MQYVFGSLCRINFLDEDGEIELGYISNRIANDINSAVSDSLSDGFVEYIDRKFGITDVSVRVFNDSPFEEAPYGYAFVQTIANSSKNLTAPEINELIEEISGQFSDGWGEGFEQNAVDCSGVEVYVNFWFSSRNSAPKWEMKLIHTSE